MTTKEQQILQAYAEGKAAGIAEGQVAPQATDRQDERWAIDGAIQFGRDGINKPPSDDHWLMEYWNIGQALRTKATEPGDAALTAHVVRHIQDYGILRYRAGCSQKQQQDLNQSAENKLGIIGDMLELFPSESTSKADTGEAIRNAALEEAAQVCLQTIAPKDMERAIGVAAHYASCAAAIRALKSVTPQTKAMPPKLVKQEIGWCIERGSPSVPEYLYVQSERFEWTVDNTKAIRFSRRSDAEQVSEIVLDESQRIAEHVWMLAGYDFNAVIDGIYAPSPIKAEPTGEQS